MRVNAFNVNVCSEDPARLIAFYENVVGLPRMPQLPGAFMAGTTGFLVDGHSLAKGMAKEPHRVLLTFTIDDVTSEQARLEAAGVRFVRPAAREPWGGLVATFEDPDGNYCQIIEYPKA